MSSLVFPRGSKTKPQSASPFDVPQALRSVSQAGNVQTRDTTKVGRFWSEEYPLLRAGDPEVERLMAFIRRVQRSGQPFWIDHPTVPGSGRPINGTADENLIRDAAMDTDTDGDGVVDGFQDATDAVVTLSVDQSAQKFAVTDGTGITTAQEKLLLQRVLRVFPGDEVTHSVEGKISTGDDVRVATRFVFNNEDGNSVPNGITSGVAITNDTFTRAEFTATAPDGATLVQFRAGWRATADGATGSVWIRNARVLRASSDPAVFANPHVSGGGQTGDTLATAGWPASTTVLRAGDFFRVGGSGATQADAEADEVTIAFEATEDVTSDSNGDATIPVNPPVFSSLMVPDGAALRFQNMRFNGMLWQPPAQTNLRSGFFYDGVNAIFREIP